VLLCSACYQPTVATGIPCSTQGDCPQGQVCAATGRCELPGRDAADVDIAIDAPLGAWSAPQLLVELNSPMSDTDPSITADGLDIIFASSRTGGVALLDLYRASRSSRSEPFGAPVLIMELSTLGNDNAAEISGDGLTIYLRKNSGLSPDVFVAHRQSRTDPFDIPVIEPDLSSPEAETNPAISRDGLTFSTTRELGLARELYLYERADLAKPWGPARQLTELSSMNVDSGAAFMSDGLAIVFHSDRDSPTLDIADLYIATRPNKNKPFGAAVPITELNTPGNESDATITADGRLIIWDCLTELCFATR